MSEQITSILVIKVPGGVSDQTTRYIVTRYLDGAGKQVAEVYGEMNAIQTARAFLRTASDPQLP